MFPAYGHSKENQERSKEECDNDGGNGNFVQLGWLQNRSYTSKAAENLASIELELRHHSETEEEQQHLVTDETETSVVEAKAGRKHKKHKKTRRKCTSPALETPLVHNLQVEGTASKKIFLGAVDVPADRAFHVDLTPDRTNLAFASLPPLQIAKYARNIRCLGLKSKHQKELYWQAIKSNVKGKRNKTKKRPKYERRYYTRLKELYSEAQILDLSRASSKCRLVEQEGKQTPGALGTVVSPYMETGEEYSTRLTTEFNEHLRKFPHDLHKWIAFVDFQDDIKLDLWSARAAAQKFVLEKKLAILDKAIEFNPTAVDLLLIKFQLCRDVWDSKRLSDEWKKVLFVHPNNTVLWKRYLVFFQTQFSTFTVSRFGKIFAKCFDVLRRIHAGTFLSHQPLPGLEQHMIEIFSHFCHILCQSGYREKAIANFQALIEFNLFVPSHLSEGSAHHQHDYWLTFFEPFWDSGVPRFGEAGALGWRQAMERKNITHPSEIPVMVNEEELLDLSSSKSINWLKLEQSRAAQHWLPWRPNDAENDCDDPDRTVLFDDVSTNLFRLKQDGSKFLLVQHFLQFLGVCVEPHLQFACDHLSCHHPTFVEDGSQVLQHCQHFKWAFYSSDLRQNLESSLSVSVALSQPESDGYRAFIQRAIEQAMKLFASHEVTLVNMWVSHKCEATTARVNDSAAFVNKRLKDCKTFVKKLLKVESRRNHLRLWCEYARLEWRSGNLKEARKIFDIALAMKFSDKAVPSAVKTRDAEEMLDLCHAHRVAAEMEIHSPIPGDSSRTTLILLHLGCEGHVSLNSDTIVSASSILKARTFYKTGLGRLLKDYQLDRENVENDDLLRNHGNLLAEWTICYAMLEYVTEGLTSANNVYEEVLRFLDDESLRQNDSGKHLTLRNGFNCELLYMSYVQLHVTHSNRSIVSLGILRAVLSRALEAFPENRHFNSLFLDIESKSHIAGRVRRHYDAMFRSSGSSKAGPVSVIHSIMAELERQKILLESQASTHDVNQHFDLDAGIIHRLRALFQRAIDLPQLRSCVLLWRLYLKFEVMQGNLSEGKEIFYRALQQSPWAKVLYFDALQYFPNDLQAISDILTEKEIRVRAPLEEVLLLLGSELSELKEEPGQDSDMESDSIKD